MYVNPTKDINPKGKYIIILVSFTFQHKPFSEPVFFLVTLMLKCLTEKTWKVVPLRGDKSQAPISSYLKLLSTEYKTLETSKCPFRLNI